MAKKHMKRCSASLATGETQIKTTVRHHLTPTRLAKFFFFFNGKNKCWKGVEKLKSWCIGKQFCLSSKS